MIYVGAFMKETYDISDYERISQSILMIRSRKCVSSLGEINNNVDLLSRCDLVGNIIIRVLILPS